MKTPRDHAAALMLKASHDLIAARAILAAGDAFDTACFHAQQAVEKGLKAVLALHEIEYPRRHDLVSCWNWSSRWRPIWNNMRNRSSI